MEELFAADLFCGAGGTSTGLLQAAKKLNKKIRLVAVNHWDLAIATHSANHPGVDHYNSDLRDVDPRAVVPSGKLRLLVASPECTHFSKARGGRPMSKQSRASVKYVIKWINNLDVEDVLIENVPDFMTWGPLHRVCTCGQGPNDKVKHGKGCKFGTPVENRKGEFFNRFIARLRSLGYSVAYRVLNAANYGDPTTRKRLFILARKHRKIQWPEPTHDRVGGDMFGPKEKWKSARDIIDWSLKGESVFSRKKPLSPNTMRRIYAGLAKFGGKAFVIGQQSGSAPRSVEEPIPTIAGAGAISLIEPFLMTTNWTATNRSQPRSVDEPMPTVTGQGSIALVEPFLVEYHGGGGSERRTRSVNDPLPTLDTSNRFGLVEPFIMQMEHSTAESGDSRRVYPLSRPLPTVTRKGMFGLVEPFLVEYYGKGSAASIDQPLGTVTGNDRFGLAEPAIFEMDGGRYILDIRFRMLQPHELAAAMSFPSRYKFQGTRDQAVKQIGNSVPVGVAEALCRSLLQ